MNLRRLRIRVDDRVEHCLPTHSLSGETHAEPKTTWPAKRIYHPKYAYLVSDWQRTAQ
jgi:hypothetical protein